MNDGYKKFFKAAQANKGPGKPVQKPMANKVKPQFKKKSGISEEELRAAFNMPPRKKMVKGGSKFPSLTMVVTLMAIFGVVGFGYSQPKILDSWLNQFEISFFADAEAADDTTDTAKSSATKGDKGEKSAATGEKSGSAVCPEPYAMSEEDLSHFSRLSERKRELDLREQELNALEEELHRQRSEVEARIQKLENIRAEISTVLKDRVEIDQQRVNTLVEFYSNMKPKQAADIFANLNEDLAVEVLTKMKKKNAAEIMNLLPAEKARTLSEKFTGYKKR